MVAAVMAQEQSELTCVMIPLNGTQLLLPNVSIAEILMWRRIKNVPDAPHWCLGLLGWRGQSIPVVRFECLNDARIEERKTGRCMIVMNRARSSGGVEFYALAAESLPRMVQLAGDDLSSETCKLGPAEVAAVKVGTESAIIPDLEYVEKKVNELDF